MFDGLDRLACEVLPNGRVLARNVRNGEGFVVRPLSDAAAQAPVSSQAKPAPSDKAGRRDPPRLREEKPKSQAPSEVLRFSPMAGAADVAVEVIDEDPSGTQSTVPPEDVEDGPDEFEHLDSALGPLSASTADTSRIMALVDRVRSAPSDLIAWHEALDGAVALVPAEAGAALECERNDQLRFLHAFGPRAAGVQGAVMPVGMGIAGFSVTRVASLLVTDTRSDARFCSDFDQVTGYATHAVICVPVAYEGQVFGCLELLNPTRPDGFDRTQMETVERFANALAIRLCGSA